MSPGLEMMIKEYDASTVDDEYSDVSPIYSLAQRQETEMSRSQRHSWDICEKLLPRQWPDGHCKFVYSASDDIEAGRHMSGWAMRNTNNHNALVLKKSCLGVLACSRPCLDADSKPLVNLRPAICDKARAKQIGRPCPTPGCDGHLLLKPCEGHGGYPVTHFWRTANSNIYFQSKGSHSHRRPVRFWPLVERRQRATNNDNKQHSLPLKAKKSVKKSRSESENSEIRISSKSTKASSSSSSSAAAAAAAVTLNSFDCNFPMYSPVTKYSEWSRDTRRTPGSVSRGFQPETFGQRLLITTGSGSDWEHGAHLNASYEEEFWIRQYQDQCHDQGQADGQAQWQPIYQRNYDQGSMCSKDFIALQPYHPGIAHYSQHHHHHSHSRPCSREYMHSYGINRPLKVEECYSCYDGGPSTGLCCSSSSSSKSRSSSTAAVRFVASNDADGSFFPSEMEHFWTLQQTYDPDTHPAPFHFSEPSSSSYVTQSPPSFYEQKALVTSSPSMFDSYIPLDTLHVLDPEQVEEEFRRMEPQSMEFNCQMQQGANAFSGGHFQLKIEDQK